MLRSDGKVSNWHRHGRDSQDRVIGVFLKVKGAEASGVTSVGPIIPDGCELDVTKRHGIEKVDSTSIPDTLVKIKKIGDLPHVHRSSEVSNFIIESIVSCGDSGEAGVIQRALGGHSWDAFEVNRGKNEGF